ncbi:MAG: response regulator [Longimicrobiales bacterium]|nr:response regulator [Longimicrobiales bacterium]
MGTGSLADHSRRLERPVYVVDGDPSVGESVRFLLRALQVEVELFTTAEEALLRIEEAPPLCLISEVYLPGMSGIDLQRQLQTRGIALPVIMLATHADVPLAVEAMQLGALDFVEKPTIERVVLARVREAIRKAPRIRAQGDEESPTHG